MEITLTICNILWEGWKKPSSELFNHHSTKTGGATVYQESMIRFWRQMQVYSFYFSYFSLFYRTFPNCKFGDKCVFIHPNCKFDARCKKITCPFTHASKRTPSTPKPPPPPPRKLAMTLSRGEWWWVPQVLVPIFFGFVHHNLEILI